MGGAPGPDRAEQAERSPASASRWRWTARPTSSSTTRTSRARARSAYGPKPTASPRSTTSATARSSVSRIKEIEDAHRFGGERIVAARLLLDPAQHGFEPFGIGHGNAANVEEVDDGADGRKGRVMLQVETCQQHLERHAVTNVRELRAVEVEADGLARPLVRPFDPDELRLRVDEALDQPGAGQAIDPRILAGRPGPLLVTVLVDQPQALPGGARPAARGGVAPAAPELRARLGPRGLGLG